MNDCIPNKRDFDSVASEWDTVSRRRELTKSIAEAIVTRLSLRQDMRAMDFGAGTGLLTLRILPHVQSFTACDSSSGMLNKLEKKLQESKIDRVTTRLFDIERENRLQENYDLIVSSMTMHHITDPAKAIRIFYDGLVENGQIGIADLDVENGDFHSDRTGVYHFGFDRDEMVSLFKNTGFHSVEIETAHTIQKPIADGEEKDFPVFLITAMK